MKLLALTVLVVVVVAVSSEKKSSLQLLGADDVDKKVAERQEADKQEVVVPHNLREIKKLAKNDRALIKEMQTRARTLKIEMGDKKKSKSEKKELKKQYKDLKKSLHAKRDELNTLKIEKRNKKSQHMKGKPAKKTNSYKGLSVDDKDRLLMEEAKELSALTTTTTVKPTTKPTEATTQATNTQEFNKKAARRKSQRKNEKKANKKNRNKNNAFDKLETDHGLNKMQGDQPASQRGVHLFKKRPVCESDSDCTGGTKCRVNRHGVKRCKPAHHGTNKKAGKKCHSSEQCMTGLKCFVTKTAEQKTHKKHPRRGKGVCADPATTDASKGTFIPLKTEVKA